MLKQVLGLPLAITPDDIRGKPLATIYGDLVPEMWTYGNGWVTRYAKPDAPIDIETATKQNKLPFQQRITTTLVTIPVSTAKSAVESIRVMLPEHVARTISTDNLDQEQHWLFLMEDSKDNVSFVHIRHQPHPAPPPKVVVQEAQTKNGSKTAVYQEKAPEVKILREIFTIPTSPAHLEFLLDKLIRAVKP